MDALLPGTGHNNPPDVIALLTLELQQSNEPLLERKAELLGMEERLPAADIIDEDWATKLSDAIKSCTMFTKNSEAARVSAKEPHLAASRVVDGFFKNVSDPVDRLKNKMSGLLTGYLRKKADEERRERERLAAEAKARADEEARTAREAKRKADEAEAAAREAERQAAEAKTHADLAAARKARQDATAAAEAARVAKDNAVEAKQDANVTRTDATAKAADMHRTRSTLGSVASLRTTWVHELVDLDLVPQDYLSLNDGAVRQAIKANTTRDGRCKLTIPGIRIYEKQDGVVR